MAQLQSTSITGSLIVTQGITGSFSGSISNAISASYAATASYALNAGDSVWTGSAGNIYYSGGNVGIGNTTPGGKLDVIGNDNVFIATSKTGDTSLPTKAVATLNGIYNNGSNGHNLFITSTAATGDWEFNTTKTWGGFMSWGVSSDGTSVTRQLYLTSAGNVGIGTTNPGYKLTVAGDVALGQGLSRPVYYDPNGGNFQIKASAGGWATGYFFQGSGGTYRGGWGGYGSSDSLIYLWAGDAYNTPTMVVQGGQGNVGIGTTNPTGKLQVDGGQVRISNGGSFATLTSSQGLAFDLATSPYGIEFLAAVSGAGYGHRLISVDSGVGAGIFKIQSRDNSGTWSDTMSLRSGNVGIGTTNPSQKFVVSNGSSEVFKVYSTGEVVVDTNYIYAAYSSGTSFYSQGPASFRNGIHNDTSTYLKIDGGTSGFTYFSGNVGIGTTNPAAKLYIVGSSQNTLALDSPAYPELTFRVSGTVKSYDAIVTTNQGYFNTSTVGDRIYRTEAGNHLFGYSTTEIMRIASGGNVGIGTANPTEKLHVIGNTIIQATSTGNGTTAVRVNNSAGTQVLAIGAAGEIIMNNSSKISTIVDPTSTQPQLELYNAGTGYTTLQSSTSYGLLLNPNGSNVGIGTTNPAYKLDVFGIDDTTPEIRIGNSSGKTAFIGFSSTYGFDVDAGGVGGNYLNLKGGNNGSTGGITFSTFALERMRIDYTGNIGIGTTNPSQKLVVNGRAIVGGGLTGDALSISTSIGTYTFNGYDLLTPSSFLITAGSSGYLSLDGYPVIFKVSGGERMRVNTDGNIGIGTTSPTYKLDVVGIIRSNSSNVGTVNLGTDSFSSSNTTSQVIGQTSPSYTSTGKLSFKVLTWGVGSDYGPTEQMYIDVTGPDTKAATLVMLPYGGNVGIGITSPESKLHIAQSNAGGKVTLYIDNNASSTLNNEATIKFSVDSGASATNGGAEISTINVNAGNGNSDLTFKTFNASSGFTEKVRFTTDGNVGIGNTAPAFKLDVNGTVRFSAEAYIAGVWSTSYGPRNSGDPIKFVDWNATELVRINTTNGNVGIGTTSSGYKLHINGTSYFADTIYNGGGYISWTAGYSDGTTQTYNGNSLAFLTNSSSYTARMFITSGGNIGIGTTNPASLLHIYGSGNTFTRYTNTSNSGHYIDIGANGAGESFVYGYGAYPLLFGTNGSERMRITSAGNVGIGTTSPNYKLDVNGYVNIFSGNGLRWGSGDAEIINSTYSLLFKTYDGSALTEKMRITSAGNVGIGTAAPLFNLQVGANSGTLATTTIRLQNSYLDTNGYYGFNIDAVDNGVNGHDLRFLGRTTPTGGFSELVRIKNGGSVGIGTTNPTGKLTISQNNSGGVAALVFTEDESTIQGPSANTKILMGGNLSLNAASTWVAATNGSERMRITSAGNVGIGTTSPSNKLEVYTSATAENVFSVNNGTQRLQLGVNNSEGSFVFEQNSYALRFGTANTERMRITSAGNVGIGTTGPATRFEVYGAHSNTTARLYSTGDGAGLDASLDMWASEPGITYTGSGIGNNVNGHPYYGRRNSSLPQSYIRFYNGEVILNTGSTTASATLTVKADGNVGIGVTNPSYKLQVAGTSWFTAEQAISYTDSIQSMYGGTGYSLFRMYGNSNGVEMQIDTHAHNSGAATIGTYSNSDVFIKTNQTNRMVVKAGGNVGIGTTSPSRKLDVAGDMTLTTGGYIYGDSTNTYLNLSQTNGTLLAYSSNSQLYLAGSVTTLSAGNNYLGLITNGSERLRITSAGNVGIGLTTPQKVLDVFGSAGIVGSFGAGLSVGQFAGIHFGYTESHIGGDNYKKSALVFERTDNNNQGGNASGKIHFLLNNSGNSSATTLSAAVVTIDSDANGTVGSVRMGVGTRNPTATLNVSGSTNVLNVRGSGSAVTSSIFSVDGNNGRLFEVSDDLSNSLFSVNTIAGLPVIEAFADYTVTMGTYGAYTLQVTGSRVGVGTSSPGYPLHVSGSVSGISIYATNDIAAFSDQSVKTDLQVIDSAVDRIKQINGYTYVRVDDLSNTRRAGVIAQEVQKVLPEVVSENSDGTLNVAYSNMIALLIEGMKEQQAQIDKLREDLEDLRYEL